MPEPQEITVQELGKRFKAKNPDYSWADDVELGRRLKQREGYSWVKDMPAQSSQPPAPKPPQAKTQTTEPPKQADAPKPTYPVTHAFDVAEGAVKDAASGIGNTLKKTARNMNIEGMLKQVDDLTSGDMERVKSFPPIAHSIKASEAMQSGKYGEGIKEQLSASVPGADMVIDTISRLKSKDYSGAAANLLQLGLTVGAGMEGAKGAPESNVLEAEEADAPKLRTRTTTPPGVQGKKSVTSRVIKTTAPPEETPVQPKQLEAGQGKPRTTKPPEAKQIAAPEKEAAPVQQQQEEAAQSKTESPKGSAEGDEVKSPESGGKEVEVAAKPAEKPKVDDPAGIFKNDGAVTQVPIEEIEVDPKRFQFRKEASGKHGVVEKAEKGAEFDQSKAGPLAVWEDPADGKTYLVDGHHRLQLAKAAKYDKPIDVQQIEAGSPEEAKVKGELLNIKKGTVETSAQKQPASSPVRDQWEVETETTLPVTQNPQPHLSQTDSPTTGKSNGTASPYILTPSVDVQKIKQQSLPKAWTVPTKGQKSYGGIIVSPEGKFLLRKPTNNHAGYAWTWPKGKPDASEHPVETALQETKEETGHTGKIFGILSEPFNNPESDNTTHFYLMKPDDNPSAHDTETEKTQWATYEEAKELINQTKNKAGKKRDLAILDAAHNKLTAYAEAINKNPQKLAKIDKTLFDYDGQINQYLQKKNASASSVTDLPQSPQQTTQSKPQVVTTAPPTPPTSQPPQQLNAKPPTIAQLKKLNDAADQKFVQIKNAGFTNPKAANVGGVHSGKQFYTDSQGSQWLFKPKPSGWKSFVPYAEEAGYKIGRLIKPNAVEVRHIELGGKTGTIQKMLVGAKEITSDLSRLTKAQLETLQTEQLVDWLSSNHDAHAKQFLIDKDGALVGIDKGQSFKHFGVDKLHPDYAPSGGWGFDPIYKHLHEQVKNGKVKLNVPALKKAISKIEAIPNKDLIAAVKDYAEARWADKAKQQKFYDDLIARKNGIRDTAQQYWSDVSSVNLAKIKKLPSVTGDGPKFTPSTTSEKVKAPFVLVDKPDNVKHSYSLQQQHTKEVASLLKNEPSVVKYAQSHGTGQIKDVIDGMVGSWAGSSKATKTSLAMQIAAHEMFGGSMDILKKASNFTHGKSLFDQHGEAFKAILKAQYDLTQEYFKKHGIKSLIVYRGQVVSPLHTKGQPAISGSVTIEEAINSVMQPLSSFTTEANIAVKAKYLIVADVPVEKIHSFSGTGLGTQHEKEVVVAGNLDGSSWIIYGQSPYKVSKEWIQNKLDEVAASFK